MSEKEFFKGKTVVITGASSGIGRALAYEFAANGANVVIGARHDTKLAGIAGDLTNRGAAVAWCAADVTREEDCRRLVETAVARFGGIDILVCNAGISMRALFDNVQLDVLRRLMDVNFWERSTVPNTPCPTCRRPGERSSEYLPWPDCTGCRDVPAIRPPNTP